MLGEISYPKRDHRYMQLVGVIPLMLDAGEHIFVTPHSLKVDAKPSHECIFAVCVKTYNQLIDL